MRIKKLIRDNIQNLKPYSSARNEYSGSTGMFLDANENSIGSVISLNLNRYPDPLQKELKQRIADLKQISVESIFLGNGSDEAIDLLIRAFCAPGIEKIMIFPPTYGIYSVSAAINEVEVIEIPLNEDFDLNSKRIFNLKDDKIKIIFICSPNNPTGNCMSRKIIRDVLSQFNALVVVDEAYIDFSNASSWITELNRFENLVVLQTFSKAWGLANIRLGMAFANPQVIQVLNRIKYPYNVNGISQKYALEALERVYQKEKMVRQLIAERESLKRQLEMLPIVSKIYPSQANFLLVKFMYAHEVYQFLLNNNIIVRDRSNVILCNNCLRITIGNPEENRLIIETLKKMEIKK
jgi:histidinol-phosphate aminotransferase